VAVVVVVVVVVAKATTNLVNHDQVRQTYACLSVCLSCQPWWWAAGRP